MSLTLEASCIASNGCECLLVARLHHPFADWVDLNVTLVTGVKQAGQLLLQRQVAGPGWQTLLVLMQRPVAIGHQNQPDMLQELLHAATEPSVVSK